MSILAVLHGNHRRCLQVEFYGLFCARVRGTLDSSVKVTELAWTGGNRPPIKVGLPIIDGELCIT